MVQGLESQRQATGADHRSLWSAGSPAACEQAIAEDFSQFRVAPRRGGRAGDQAKSKAPASGVRLGVCYYLLGRYYRGHRSAEEGDGGAMAQFYLAKASSPVKQYEAAAELLRRPRKAGYDAAACALARAEALRLSGDPQAALSVLDDLSGAVEQTAEYLYQRGATRGRPRRQSDRSRGPVRAGRRGRSQPSRRPVRPGPGKRPPRQRRHGPGTLQAVGRTSFPRTSARC